jgi:ABC-type amino acid transport substrate-binding protein
MRKLTVLLIFLAVTVATLAAGTSKSTTKTAKAVSGSAPSHQAESSVSDSPDTIDGAKHPELIPDDVAYALFFRFLSDRQTKEEKKSMRAYFNQSVLDGVDVDSLLAVGEEFKQKAAVIDAQAQAFRERNPMQPNEQATALFREQYKTITLQLAASLPVRIGAVGAQQVRLHINERVKHHMKIVPGPVMPDGAHEMQQP